MSPLDNSVLNAIGRLQANDESSQRQRQLIFEKLDAIAERVSAIPALKEHLERHCDEIAELKTRANSLETSRAKIIAFAAGISAAGGAAGTWLAKIIGIGPSGH